MNTEIDFTRIKRLMDARSLGIEDAIKAEDEIASELVDSDILNKDPSCLRTAHADAINVTPFRAAEALAKVLDGYLPINSKGKYDPKFASARTVKDLWSLRQTIDRLGLPYDLYIAIAVPYVGKPNGRGPRLSQLIHRDVVAHVAREWVGKP